MAVSDGRPIAPPVATVVRAAVPAAERRAVPRRLRNILSLNDFEAAAKRYLPKSIFAYVHNGAESEVTLRDNREAFKDWQVVPRVLVGVANRSQKATLFLHSKPSQEAR